MSFRSDSPQKVEMRSGVLEGTRLHDYAKWVSYPVVLRTISVDN